MAVPAGFPRRARHRPGGRMNLRRIFANAIARRVAYVLVAAALAWLGLGEARAAHDDPDQGQAYLHCLTGAAAAVASVNQQDAGKQARNPKCTLYGNAPQSAYQEHWEDRPRLGGGIYGAHQPRDGEVHRFPLDKKCSDRADFTTTFAPKSGSSQCAAGCVVAYYRNDDGTSTGMYSGDVCDGNKPEFCEGVAGHYWNRVLAVCEPLQPDCPAGEVLNSLGQCAPEPCPSGMAQQADGTCKPKENECPAGQQKAPDGSCIEQQCPAGQVKGPDGTCKNDDDDDGEEDDDQEESFSGGDTCDQPPQCSGSPIACGQARIQWRIDCNTRKNRNISGGSCSAMPVCAGEKCDAMEYASLIQQWKAACSLEALARDGVGGGGDSGVVDLLTGPGTHDSNAVGGDTLADGGPGGGGGDDDEIEPDRSGFGYGSSCPSPPTVQLPNGASVTFDLTPLCNWVALAGNIVLILAGLVCLRIVSGANA